MTCSEKPTAWTYLHHEYRGRKGSFDLKADRLHKGFGGCFIVLDGPDGCGKSSQSRMLTDWLQGQGVAVVGFRDPGTTVWRAVGCAACNHTGYKGRIGVFEAIKVDETIRKLINDGGDEAIIARHAFLHAPTLGSAARALVRAGDTTPEEAIRISRREDEPPAEPAPPTAVDA